MSSRSGEGSVAGVRVGRSADLRPPRSSTVAARLYEAAQALAFVGLLNILIVCGALAGGVILGLAPALAAAAHVSRSRLRGDERAIIRRFAVSWRGSFVSANAMQAPGWLIFTLLCVNLAAFGPVGVLGAVLIVALCLTAAYQILVVTMDAHYALHRRDVLRSALAFLVHSPGSPLLLVAMLATVGAVTVLVPGLLPVVSVGAASHLSTALCLSFYEANDRRYFTA